ncbi:MAG: hypothetical protein ACLFRT_14080 [Actinomycetota bacterium]
MVRRYGLRHRAWALAALGQALAVAAIGLTGLTLDGLGLGIVVLALLVLGSAAL